MEIVIHPQAVLKTLLYLIVTLLCVNILGITSKMYFDHDTVYGLVPLFDLNTEKNIPTLYSSFALMVSSLLLWLVALMQRSLNRPYIPWIGLAIIFLFLSIDEVVTIHERLTVPMRELLNTTGLLYFAWVIPYGVALVVFVAGYAKFLINLPKRTRYLFIISGVVFVLGAIGFELLGARQASLYDYQTDLGYAIYYTFEEFFEMLGIVLFIYTLLDYITNQFKCAAIHIKK